MSMYFDFAIKLRRANHHMENLQAAFDKWRLGDHHSVFNEPNPDGGPHDFRVRVISDPIPQDPFAVLVGDIVHNLRGALDHLAFALAERHFGSPLTKKIEKESEFPIYGNVYGNGAQLFTDKQKSKIGAMHQDAQAFIERLQPYHRGDQYGSDPLWMLHEISNIDKHRLLMVGAAAYVTINFNPSVLRDYDLENVEVFYKEMIEPEAVVMTYTARPRNSTNKVGVEFDPVLEIVFKRGESVKGKNIIKTMQNILRYVTINVADPLRKFL